MENTESDVRQDCQQLLAIVKDDEQLRAIRAFIATIIAKGGTPAEAKADEAPPTTSRIKGKRSPTLSKVMAKVLNESGPLTVEEIYTRLMASPLMPSDPIEAAKEINSRVNRDHLVFMRLPNGGRIATRKWMRKNGHDLLGGNEPPAQAAE